MTATPANAASGEQQGHGLANVAEGELDAHRERHPGGGGDDPGHGRPQRRRLAVAEIGTPSASTMASGTSVRPASAATAPASPRKWVPT